MFAQLKSITRNYQATIVQPALEDYIPMKRSCSWSSSDSPKRRRIESSSEEEMEEFHEIYDHRFTHNEVMILVNELFDQVWIPARGPYAPRAFKRYVEKINEIEVHDDDVIMPETLITDLTRWKFDCMRCREDSSGFTYCGHYSLCANCASHMSKCPVCGHAIDYFHYAFFNDADKSGWEDHGMETDDEETTPSLKLERVKEWVENPERLAPSWQPLASSSPRLESFFITPEDNVIYSHEPDDIIAGLIAVQI